MLDEVNLDRLEADAMKALSAAIQGQPRIAWEIIGEMAPNAVVELQEALGVLERAARSRLDNLGLMG